MFNLPWSMVDQSKTWFKELTCTVHKLRKFDNIMFATSSRIKLRQTMKTSNIREKHTNRRNFLNLFWMNDY